MEELIKIAYNRFCCEEDLFKKTIKDELINQLKKYGNEFSLSFSDNVGMVNLSYVDAINDFQHVANLYVKDGELYIETDLEVSYKFEICEGNKCMQIYEAFQKTLKELERQ